VIEDLHVAGMLRNRRLARHIAGVGMGELRRQITYKNTWSGGAMHLADRWFPSSKTCSGCGVVKTKLRLSERTAAAGALWCWTVISTPPATSPDSSSRSPAARPPRVAGRRETSPRETRARPAPCGQRVPPREDPRGQRRAARRRLPEQSGLTFTHT
jgi:putative transposase